MPSTVTFSISATTKTPSTSIYTRPQKRQKMSLTQTYFLAHSARGKLSKEAARPDHRLRNLVGHANLLDSLMLDLANAEQEQERWFNTSVSGAKDNEEKPSSEWAETIVEEPEADWEAEDAEASDDEAESEDEAKFSTLSVAAADVAEDEEENNSALALTRTPSRHSPPELSIDSDSDSDDDNLPPSPLQNTFFCPPKNHAISTTTYLTKKAPTLSASDQETFADVAFILSSRQDATVIAAF